jgi:hypothetical protein
MRPTAIRPTAIVLALVLVLSAAVTASSQTLDRPVDGDCHTWDSAAGAAAACETAGRTLPVGSTAFEPTMGVDPDGALYMATTPGSGVAIGFGVGVHKSTDRGATWTDVQPRVAGRALPPETNDPYAYVDPGTGRVFSFHMSPILLCSIMSFSDDGGATWTTPPVGCGPSGAWDHQTMTAAPPTDGVITLGYPNVLVQCVNSVYAEMCARSLDGGMTWGTGYPVYANENLASLCGTQTGHLFSDRDGVIYLPTPVCGDRASMYVSEDSGLTWEERVIHEEPMPFTDPAIDVDGAGVLHATWVDSDSRLNYATSADKGLTWTEPVFATAPGLVAALPALVAGDEGRLAIAFSGTADLPNGYDSAIRGADLIPIEWGAYLAVAEDATDGTPTFDVVRTSGADPIERGQSCSSRCQFLVDFIDVVLTPDGQPFGAFVDGCRSAECVAGERDDDGGNGHAIVGTLDVDLCADVCHPFADAVDVASSPLASPSIELAAPTTGSAMAHPADVLGEARYRHLHDAYTEGLHELFGG